jgi:transcriptional adapter 3
MKGKSKEQQPQITTNQSLSLPNVQAIDYQKNCPRYTSILHRADGDGVGIEEMDSLQMEIESLLVNVMQRTRSLKMETLVLDNWTSDKSDSFLIQTTPQKQIGNGGAAATAAAAAPATPVSTTKDSMTKDKSDPSQKKLKPTVSKPPQFALQNFIHTDTHAPIVRNDIPDLFWQSVEPYCADITDEDIKLLENQIDLNQKYSSFSKTIGPLGKHYALQWAEEDLNQQMKEGQRFVDLDGKGSGASPVPKRKGGGGVEQDKSSFKRSASFMLDDTLHILNGKGNNPAKSDTLTYGPLTQRLISALIEQNLMTPFDNELADYLEKIGPPQSMYLSPKSMAKKLTFSSTNAASSHSSLERKIKKTLIEQGILDFDENDKTLLPEAAAAAAASSDDSSILDKDDQIGLEIRNLQNELRTVTSQCELTLTQLLHTSKKKLVKQEMKRKLTVLDYEVIEAYEKCKHARLEKRTLTKKEKEKIFKLLKDRDATKSQLDTFV